MLRGTSYLMNLTLSKPAEGREQAKHMDLGVSVHFCGQLGLPGVRWATLGDFDHRGPRCAALLRKRRYAAQHRFDGRVEVMQ